ncbi:alpha-mannosidase 2x-like [Physella acuta]|uniref:alpha-mannosidase 2x-like n=1 Tax=Physella acuta TaxID=109671 RepID=UPI0027DB92A0|nr:alpha-mannosidase 2x-like [Physella acuta]
MLFMGNMKFWHRVVAVGVLALVLLGVYKNLPEEALQTELQEQHQLLFGRKNSQQLKGSSQTDAKVCGLLKSSPGHHANLSTYDVFQNTNFILRSDGQWEMPIPTKHSLTTSSRPKLNVILMPHSHNDPGWLKSVNEYYSDQTRNILNNMVNKLTQYPNMTFIWTEIVFFSMWWNELDDSVKVHVKRLIRRGQLEMTLGGWVMPDEASTHYVAVIDQLVEGHQWLWENLGVRPQNSWSIDPFGHSGTMPYIWHSAGMSNMVIQRIHQSVKTSLFEKKSLEFNWRQMWDDKGSTDIMCHVMPFMLYNIKYTCGPNPFSCLAFDFRKVPGDYTEALAKDVDNENLAELSELLYYQYQAKAFYYRYNTILVPIGDDFRYDKEVEWDQQYTNYEKLIHFINSKTEWNTHIQWGTLKDYFKLVKQELDKRKSHGQDSKLPTLSGDFFPYSDRDGAYWTGYYSTRAFDKYFCRDVQSTIQAADILNTLNFAYYKKLGLATESKFLQHSSFLQAAHRALGLFLHHDAITGTSKSFVAEDYEQYLLRAYNNSQEVMKMAIQSIISGGKVETPVVFKPETARKNHQSMPAKQVISVQDSGTTVVFFNPLAQPRQQMVHLLVDAQTVEVLTISQDIIPNQVGPVWDRDEDATVSSSVFELSFMLDIGPLSLTPVILYKKTQPPVTSYFSTLTVYNTNELAVSGDSLFVQNRPENERTSPITVDNKVIQLSFDPKTGSLLNVLDLVTNNVTQLNLNFMFYNSKGSGAYLFSPQGPATVLFPNIPIIRVAKGPLLTHVEVSFQPYITHRVTIYNHPTHLASGIFIENILNIITLQSKEIVMHFNTDIKNPDRSFYTDQNGFQFIRRHTNPVLGIQANFYPMTSAVLLEDEITRLTLLSAQPHGASSLDTGHLEVMLDRHLLYDDERGLGEGVTDIKTTISRFVLLVERRTTPSTLTSQTAALSLLSLTAHDILQQPTLAYYTTVDTDIFFKSINPTPRSFPCDTSLVSLRSLANRDLAYNGTSIILHRRGYDCDFPQPSLVCSPSDPTVTFDQILKDFNFSNLRETSLTHTVIKRTLNPKEPLKISPMELAAYHVQL